MLSRMADLELVEEKREMAQQHLSRYTQKMKLAYEKKVQVRGFQLGDLVLMAKDHVMRGLHATKFTPNWGGPYELVDIRTSGYCKVRSLQTNKVSPPTNVKFIKKYYP